MDLAIELLVVLIVATGILSMVGPIQWAVWQARRTVLRHKQISLWGFLVAFTFVTLIVGAFSVILRGTVF